MKFYIAVAAAFAVFTVCAAGSCHEEGDCEEDECCAVKNFIVFRKGECKKLSEKDKPCGDDDSRVDYFGGKYFGPCPCDKGLECVAEGEVSKSGKTKTVKMCRATPTGEPSTEEPSTDEPSAEEPSTEEPSTDDGEGGDSSESGEEVTEA